ncbi:MAG: PTS sugar transporter subunit IIB, partial [Anaerorhabdus sp.]
MISLARIDERLIHGQVAYSWTMAYKSDAIMVIDDEVSQDQFQKDLLAFACPKDMKCLVVNETRAVELLQKYEGKKIFVVVKHPKVLLNIVKNGVELKSINVGGL